jgi:hypothetical protein
LISEGSQLVPVGSRDAALDTKENAFKPTASPVFALQEMRYSVVQRGKEFEKGEDVPAINEGHRCG